MAAGPSTSRYDTILKLAAGGMATVWVGTVRGALGFRQLVAIKKPHPHLLDDPMFRSELVAEARLASMIHHANVVDVRDVEIDGNSISLVMDYIEGASLGDLIVAANRRGDLLSARVCVRIALDALAGLQAAHDLVDERGRPVGLVHRDVSPQNILVGTDGISRVADFGVAKFSRKDKDASAEGSLKGKLAYMAPEYVRGLTIDRRFDVFGLGVVMWEALCGRRCFRGENEADTLNRLLTHAPEPVSTLSKGAAALDPVIACALAKSPDERFQNAAAMAAALEGAAHAERLVASHGDVARLLKDLVGEAIEERRALVRAKLANEPSVASLMGVPPIVAARVSDEVFAHAKRQLDGAPATASATARASTGAPPTVADAPATQIAGMPATQAAATPKMGGGGTAGIHAEPTVTAPLATEPFVFGRERTNATAAPYTSIPSTAPMTPKIVDGARDTLASNGESPHGPVPVAPTQPSASPLAAPPTPISAPAISAHAHYTLRSEAADADVSFNDPSARAYAAPGESTPLASPPGRSWIAPVIVLLASASLATTGIVFVTGRGQPASSTPTGATSSAASAASAPILSTSGATASASASGAPTTAPVATMATAAASSARTPTVPTRGRTVPTATTVTPPSSKKTPPAHPYDDP